MARSYDDKLVLCPYFIKQDAVRIHCEGWTEGYRSISITAFDSAKDRKSFAERYCNRLWTACPLCRLTAQKYDE